MNRFLYAFLFILGMSQVVFSQNVITVTDADLQDDTYTWTKDNVYLLDGFVFLESGGRLNIEAGTVIKGKEVPSSNDLASTLIITRGAQIFAEGTADEPIIFTAEIDDTNDAEDLSVEDRGLWGGLIILGNATITDNTAEESVEGLNISDTDRRGLFGGFVDTDNSGVLRYVSIRHGGAELAPGDEINGLTLGAVGSGTTLEYIEVLANSDDGIEFFGGTVNLKYASVGYCGDDSFDWDTGYRGNGQFWFVIQSDETGDNGGELDGAKPDSNTPSSNPTVFNATFIGSGQGSPAKNEHALLFRDGSRGTFANSIFTDYANYAIQVEDRASGVDSRSYMEAGELNLLNNLWFGFGEGTELNAGDNGIIQATADAEDATAQFLIDHLVANGNQVSNPLLGRISRISGLDPRPAPVSPAYTSAAAEYPDNNFFTAVEYKGAFCADGVWLKGWTAIDEYGVLSTAVPAADQDCDAALKGIVTVRDADLVAGGTYTWTNDNVYLLDGFVFLEEGGTLNIEAGTVIKGREVPTTNDLASTLIITRGAKINAIGSPDAPIIFTAQIDDTEDPTDMELDDRGLWGGLIILGNATIVNEGLTEENVEGLNISDTDRRGLYGGSDDEDCSGTLSYVSIRHGGAELAPGEEINGLTLGAVGSATVIENVEVLANEDDGIEFFGGTVNVKYAIVGYCGDDSFDWDLGYRGKGQFWFVLQSDQTGDNGGELDGAKPDAGMPSSNGIVYNATFIGSGVDSDAKNEHALLLRDGSRGTFANSIFTDYANYAIQVEDRASGVDSRSYMEAGELNLLNNIWFGFGEGTELNAGSNGIIQATADAEDATAQFLVDHLVANMNSLDDPMLGGISRTTDGGLDPRPAADGVAYTSMAAAYPDDPFFTPVNYKGAFCASGVWFKGWSAVDEYGVLNAGIAAEPANCDIQKKEIVIKDSDLVGGQTYNWTAENIYLLDGFVFLEAGGILNIEAGTIIKGLETPSTNDLASTLIITRGAQIFAEGTADAPIIFTAEVDDTDDATDLAPNDRGLWGGLIILGNATITDEANEESVEGLNISDTDRRGLFGGFVDNDNSGVLRYVSIRHGGAELAPGDEINGLTLGAVGSGTTIDYVEVIANSDDGIEFFGGTVVVNHASVAFCGDDSFDWDTGYRGGGQFWFVLQDSEAGDNGGELDGAKPDSNTPSSNPVVENVTFIGSGIDSPAKNEHALLFRDGSRGSFANSIFTDYANYAIQVEDRASGVDSRSYMEAGELVLANNVWFGFGEGTELNAGDNGIIQATADAEDPTAQFLVDHLVSNENVLADPMLRGISRTTDAGLDPRPAVAGPAYMNLATSAYNTVEYKGAFAGEGDVWLNGWTALSEYGVLGDIEVVEPMGADLAITVEADQTEVGQFAPFTVTVTVTNNGPAMAMNTVIDAALPADVVFAGAAEVTRGFYTQFGNQTWTIGMLPANESATLTLNLFSLTAGEIVAAASITSSDTADDNVENNSASVTINGEDVEEDAGADLAVIVEADRSRYSIFSQVNFTVSVTNNGPDATSDVAIAIPADLAGTVFAGSATVSQGAYTQFGDQVWTVGDLANGASATLDITLFAISDNDPLTITATIISSSVDDVDENNNTSSTTVLPGATANSVAGTTAEAIALYPNPTTERVNVTFVADANTQTVAYVMDAAGRIVAQQAVNLVEGYNELNFNVAQLADGYYFVAFEGSTIALPFRKK